MTMNHERHLNRPTKGNYAFESGLMGWAFTAERFAAIYAKKSGIDEAEMMEPIWRESYYDVEAKKWKKTSDSGKPLKVLSASSSSKESPKP